MLFLYFYSHALHICAVNLRICLNWMYYKVSPSTEYWKLHNRRSIYLLKLKNAYSGMFLVCTNGIHHTAYTHTHMLDAASILLHINKFIYLKLRKIEKKEKKKKCCCDAKLNGFNVTPHIIFFFCALCVVCVCVSLICRHLF